jgi:predicted AlkP superfamily pyrophosphatase or phosphodiesterase
MEVKLQELDKTLGYLIEQLKAHHLYDKLNLIITSDHGMEAISNKTVIFLDKYVDTTLFDAYGSRACYSIFVKKGNFYRSSQTFYFLNTYKFSPVIPGLINKCVL